MKQMNKSVAEELLAVHLKELGFKFERQFRFHTERKWRWDFLLNGRYQLVFRIAIEVDGYYKGRHGAGWGADNEKRNIGTMMGYRVLVFSTRDVLSGKAKELLNSWL